jgi:hypothetical protein
MTSNNNQSLSQQTQDLLETINVTSGDLSGNIKYIVGLISKFRIEVTLTLGAIERSASMCVDEAASIMETNKHRQNSIRKTHEPTSKKTSSNQR